MKSHTEYLTICTPNRYDIVNITPQVEAALEKSGIQEGLCLVNSMHITSSVFINDNERGLHADFLRWTEKLAPYGVDKYQHNLTGEDNGDAHLKRTLLGRAYQPGERVNIERVRWELETHAAAKYRGVILRKGYNTGEELKKDCTFRFDYGTPDWGAQPKKLYFIMDFKT